MTHRTLLFLCFAAAAQLPLQGADGLTLSANDDAFIHQVMNGCTNEIRNAEAALKRSLTDSERTFAKQVIDIHLTLQRELGVIAKNKLIATKDEVQADEQGRIVTAIEMTDKDFNVYFLKGEIRSESAEIALCEAELRDGLDEDLKLFATTYLPSLKKNLIIAREFSSKY